MRVLKWLAVAALLGFVVLIGGIYVRNKTVGPVGWAVDNTERDLRGRMKDPDSTTIRSYYVVQRPKGDNTEIFVCGYVDGKNSFGAYTGGTRFASRSSLNKALDTFDTGSVQLEAEGETRQAEDVNMLSGFEKVVWNDWCVDSQHPPITRSGS